MIYFFKCIIYYLIEIILYGNFFSFLLNYFFLYDVKMNATNKMDIYISFIKYTHHHYLNECLKFNDNRCKYNN